MTPTPEELVEAQVMDAARRMVYPPTPDVAAKVRRCLNRRHMPAVRIAARGAAILVVLFTALFATVPEVRAAVLSLLRIGSVTLLRETPAPAPDADSVPSALMLDGQTTLDAARVALPFEIRLPTHPADLGEPDHVFMPQANAATLVWMDGETIRLVLTMHLLDRQMFKYYPWSEVSTRVNGDAAAWLNEPHTLFDSDGRTTTRRIVHDHVLLWYDDELTYRLETDLSMEEAIEIAESLR